MREAPTHSGAKDFHLTLGLDNFFERDLPIASSTLKVRRSTAIVGTALIQGRSFDAANRSVALKLRCILAA